MDELAAHGGERGPHVDGWGVAFADGTDARLFRDPGAASHSPLMRFLRDHDIRSRCILGHIRKATVGGVTLANTQPFRREVGGQVHLFAHNGDLPGATQLLPEETVDRPLGDTDSEFAFCHLLTLLRQAGDPDGRLLPLAQRLTLLERFAQQLRALGPANFLYFDGDSLFVHSDRRTQADGRIAPPGLHMLHRHCREPGTHILHAGMELRHEATEQQVVLFASVPLTDEPWQPLPQGSLIVVRNGQPVP